VPAREESPVPSALTLPSRHCNVPSPSSVNLLSRGIGDSTPRSPSQADVSGSPPACARPPTDESRLELLAQDRDVGVSGGAPSLTRGRQPAA
jgi:hypothetical protein